MKNSNERLLLVLILLMGTAMRFYMYAGWSLSNDELSALARLRFPTIAGLIEGGVKPDMHPAGVQLFLYGWTALFGLSEYVVRLPFVLFGIASVWLIFLCGKRLFSAQAGLGAAALLAVLEYPVQYSQLARPYSPGLFFVLLALYFWSSWLMSGPAGAALTAQRRRKRFTGFILAMAACLYTHYFAALTAFFLYLAGGLFMTRANIRPYLLAGAAILLLYLPHAGIMMHHLRTGGLGGEGGWLGQPDARFVSEYVRYAFNDSILVFAIGGLCLALSVRSLFRKKAMAKTALVMLLLFILPLAGGYYYSVLVNPVLQYSVLLFSFPFLLLFLFSFMSERTPAPAMNAIVIFLLVSGSYVTAVPNDYYGKQHFAVFRELADQTLAWNDRFGSSRITRTANMHAPYYLDYFFERKGVRVPFDVYVCHTYDEIGPLIETVNRSATPYFMHAWSNIHDLPETEAVIRGRFPFIVDQARYFNSGITLYSGDSAYYRPGASPAVLFHDFESAFWPHEAACRDSSVSLSGRYSIRMDSLVEFSPGWEIRVADLPVRPPFRVFVSPAVLASGTAPGAKLVFSIDDDDGTVLWYGRELAPFIYGKNEWCRAYAAAHVTGPLSGKEVIKAYVWNDTKDSFHLDDFRIVFVTD